MMTDDSVISRLTSLGEQPIDPALASQQLTAIAITPAREPWFRQKLQVAAALVVGLLVGSTGLAAAGALPDTAQQAAHKALRTVGVNVPPGKDRVTEGCGTDENGEPFKNHGQYVKAHKDDPEASKSDCGKPRKSVKDGTDDDDATKPECPTPEPTAAATDNGNGKAKGAEKAKANAAKGCDDDDDDATGDEAEDDAVSQSPPSTTPAPQGVHGSEPGQPDETPAKADPPRNENADDAPGPESTTTTTSTTVAG